MKMTTENMKRFDDMLKTFANDNNLTVKINHEFGLNSSRVEFKLLEQNASIPITVYWDMKKSLTDACTVIFTHLTRTWNLDDAEFPSAVPDIKNVIFNDPATIILWEDGTKTVVKCQDGDEYSAELGMAMCIAKKALGNKGNFNEVFKKWLPVESAFPLKLECPRLILENPTGGMTNEFRMKLENAINDAFNDQWRKRRGLEIV